MTLFFVAVIMAGLNAQWFGPSVTENMLVMQEIEKEHGLGNQVGMSSNKEGYAKLREQDPKYKEHRTAFYRYHGLSSLCNLIGFFSTTVNLIYLALHLGTIWVCCVSLRKSTVRQIFLGNVPVYVHFLLSRLFCITIMLLVFIQVWK